MGRDLEILPLGVWEEGKQSIRLMATLETGESDCDSVSPHKVFLAPYIYSWQTAQELDCSTLYISDVLPKGREALPWAHHRDQLISQPGGQRAGPQTDVTWGRAGRTGQSSWPGVGLCRGLLGHEGRKETTPQWEGRVKKRHKSSSAPPPRPAHRLRFHTTPWES